MFTNTNTRKSLVCALAQLLGKKGELKVAKVAKVGMMRQWLEHVDVVQIPIGEEKTLWARVPGQDAMKRIFRTPDGRYVDKYTNIAVCRLEEGVYGLDGIRDESGAPMNKINFKKKEIPTMSLEELAEAHIVAFENGYEYYQNYKAEIESRDPECVAQNTANVAEINRLEVLLHAHPDYGKPKPVTVVIVPQPTEIGITEAQIAAAGEKYPDPFPTQLPTYQDLAKDPVALAAAVRPPVNLPLSVSASEPALVKEIFATPAAKKRVSKKEKAEAKLSELKYELTLVQAIEPANDTAEQAVFANIGRLTDQIATWQAYLNTRCAGPAPRG